MNAINHQSRGRRTKDHSSGSAGNPRHLCMRRDCALTGAEFKALCDALRENEQRMQLMADALPVLISYVDFRQRYQFNNAAYQKWFGNSHRSFLGRTVRSVLGEHAYARLKPNITAALAGKNQSFEMRVPYKGAGLRDVHVDYAPHRNAAGEVIGFFALIRDISERKRLERQILDASEMEQRRIAGDLHDSLGQALSGTRHLACTLQSSLAAKHSPDRHDAARIVELLAECLAETRRLARGLHPVGPEPEALKLAMQDLAARTRKLFSIECEFLSEGPAAIANHSTATHLYRIAQESVTNAVRHGRAKRITVSLTANRKCIELVIRDTGLGFRRTTQPAGMGIEIMKYRAASIGASLQITRRRPHGVEVRCRVQNRRHKKSKLEAL